MADDQHVDAAVLNAIARVTGGNFRLVQRLFAQIERIVTINNLPIVTTRSSLWPAKGWSMAHPSLASRCVSHSSQ
jgi:hypothetical protein